MPAAEPRRPQTASPSSERVTTGIAGLDEVLGAACRKVTSTRCRRLERRGQEHHRSAFRARGRRLGERTLWITMSETERELHDAAKSHGWTLDGIDILNLVVSQEVLRSEERYSFFSPADVEFNDTTRAIVAAVERDRAPARRLVRKDSEC
jgi:circadian clock protein KaiC